MKSHQNEGKIRSIGTNFFVLTGFRSDTTRTSFVLQRRILTASRRLAEHFSDLYE